MRKTKDQKDIEAILELATEARDEVYSLYSRRLDTRRNVDSFIAVLDAYLLLRDATKLLQHAAKTATDTRASSDTSVIDEVMIRGGRAIRVADDECGEQPASTPHEQPAACVIEFPKK